MQRLAAQFAEHHQLQKKKRKKEEERRDERQRFIMQSSLLSILAFFLILPSAPLLWGLRDNISQSQSLVLLTDLVGQVPLLWVPEHCDCGCGGIHLRHAQIQNEIQWPRSEDRVKVLREEQI